MARELEVKIVEFVPDFIKLLQNAKGNLVFNNTKNALDFIATAYQKVWRGFARGTMRVPGAKLIQSRGPYERSIQIDSSKQFRRDIYTDYPPHKFIEEGHSEIDLKPGLLHGSSARMGKKGPYNIVMFRHATPSTTQGRDPRGMMPFNIYNLMLSKSKAADEQKKMGLSSKGGISRQLTSGKKPENRSYIWGARLDSKLQQGRRSKVGSGYTWKAGKFAGMVRMQQKTQRSRRTQYITFRVVSYASDPRSWIVPPQEPIPIRQATMDYVSQVFNVEQVLREAIEKDIS